MKPYYQDDAVTIYHAAFADVADELPPYDVVITDPPYGTGGRRRSAVGAGADFTSSRTTRETWDHDVDLSWVAAIPTAVPVVTFWPSGRVAEIASVASTGRDRSMLLTWRKPDPMPVPNRFVQITMEPIWCFYAGTLPLSGGPDTFSHSAVRSGHAEAVGHPYQKPVDVMRWLIGLARGPVVLDPFMGSGTTLRAAKDIGRRAIGVELDERYCEIAAKRMGQEVLDFGGAA